MSDPYGSFEENPYGTAPYAGQPPPPPHGPHGPPGPMGRPANVTAAAVVTIACSALVALFGVLVTVVALGDRDALARQLEKDDRYAGIDVDSVVRAAAGVGIGVIVLSVAAIITAAFVLRGSSAARIILVILSAISIVVSLLAIASGVSIVITLAAIVVIVLLFTGGANDWFRRTKIVPYGQPPFPG